MGLSIVLYILIWLYGLQNAMVVLKAYEWRSLNLALTAPKLALNNFPLFRLEWKTEHHHGRQIRKASIPAFNPSPSTKLGKK
jgi:hypothetical protein